MNRDLYSNTEFTELKKRLNREILRRGSYKWWDPLTTPSVGEDKDPPLNIPDTDTGRRFQVDESTYTINNPSEGSIERTRNIKFPAQGENPGGSDPDRKSSVPNTSAAQVNVDEMKNFLVGLSKIQDINLFYGRDEVKNTAFRDPQGIEDAVVAAENSELNRPLHESDIPPTKVDPNDGISDHKDNSYPTYEHEVTYPIEGGVYVMPSGEYDGEETNNYTPLGPGNFYDDYGAKPGDANFHPFNRYASVSVRRDWNDQDNNRKLDKTIVSEGGISSTRFGANPRNPNKGNQYVSRPVKGGMKGSCNVACFKAGTLVETINGPVPIEEIKIGDEVLTQSGKYHKVYNTFERDCDDELISIRATGTPIIYTTNEHPFWVKKYIGIGKKDGKIQHLYSEPYWVEAKNIQLRDKLCLLNRRFGSFHVDSSVAYMVGRWLGDGWVEYLDTKAGNVTKRYVICCSFKERYELEEKLNEAGFIFSIPDASKSTAQKYHILHGKNVNENVSVFLSIIDRCGRYAYGKHLPPDIYEWDRESIESLLSGYIDSDGNIDIYGERNRTRITSVSKRLAYGVSSLMRMLHKNPSWYEREYPNNRGVIQGREVNMRKSYTVSMWNDDTTKNYSIYDGDVVWASVTLKEIPKYTYTVYNISVENDPTYYADGVLVHNCTGLCHVTCDNECSESCTSTCWNRCGNACTASCGNVCTGCSSLCYSSCKTKCEDSAGYSCVNVGARAVEITTTGGVNGEPAQNHISVKTYSCTGCSYSCQFYPNKKTDCWDSGCMGRCFTSCSTSCSTSCYGGCISNEENWEDAYKYYNYKLGVGKGCSSGCTLNCIGTCSGVCEGQCIQTCWYGCKASCSDNCTYECSTNCGSGCFNKCMNHCTGCSSCSGYCEGESSKRTCSGCSFNGGCTSTCQHDCNTNCVGWGCRSVCGIDNAGACEANCRINCMQSSCTAMCSDACANRCTTCVNTCGFQCGACTSNCSVGCGAECNITCSKSCEHTCEYNCVNSCSEECGGCSDLCYSCIGMCVGVCSVKCEDGCSSCANTCGWWCDSSCNQQCFSNCDSFCINTCSGSCATFVSSETTMTEGPERNPTSEGYIYPEPANRVQERESFKNVRDIDPV